MGPPGSAMETTPSRRTRDTGQGITPIAKRPHARVMITEETDSNVLTLQQMSDILQNVKNQYERELEWVASISVAVEDHWGRLDHHKKIIDHDKGIIADVSAQLVGTRRVVSENDASVKQILEENDRNTKAIVQDNDTTTKRIIEENDVESKNELRANDAALKVNIETINEKLNALREEQKRFSGDMEKSASAQVKLENVMNKIGAASGNEDMVKKALVQTEAFNMDMSRLQAQGQEQQAAIDQITSAYTILDSRVQGLASLQAPSGGALFEGLAGVQAPSGAAAFRQPVFPAGGGLGGVFSASSSTSPPALAAAAPVQGSAGLDPLQHPANDPWPRYQNGQPGIPLRGNGARW